MISLTPLLSIGDEKDCRPGHPDFAVVHACKLPCHAAAVGYGPNHGKTKIAPSHEHFLFKEGPDDLWLNMIDPPVPLFNAKTFRQFLHFMRMEKVLLYRRPVLIHCNQGKSRAPSLALLWMAAQGELPAGSYGEAAAVFKGLYPLYEPGAGIVSFLAGGWTDLLRPPAQPDPTPPWQDGAPAAASKPPEIL